MPSLFKPAWWCPGPHAQTIFPHIFRRSSLVKLLRQRLELPDGDFLDIDFFQGRLRAPFVMILHGLEGSSRAPYVQRLLIQIQHLGWSAAALNFRGCSGVPNRVSSTYHSGRTEDLECFVRFLAASHPGSEFYAAGYSLGGNLLLKWLGEATPLTKRILKAAAVSVPYDLAKSVALLDEGLNKHLYARRLLNSLSRKVKAKERSSKHPFVKGKRWNSFKLFDREVTAALNGFKDEWDYWNQSSSEGFLEKIATPTLLIHAEDDPFFPGKLIPKEKIEKNPFLKTKFTLSGGHLGFVSGDHPFAQRPWLEKNVLGFFKARDPESLRVI